MLENAKKDYLTGFIPREDLKPFIERLLIDAKMRMKEKVFSVALIDIDRFKRYNDRFGHSFGDLVLKYVSSTLRLTLQQEKCHIFRYGGDEFVAVFPDMKPQEVASLIKQCNYNLYNRPFLCENKFFKFSISCGVAAFPHDGREVWQLLQRADEAMYFSKRHGRAHTIQAAMIPYVKARRAIILSISAAAIIFSVFRFNNFLLKYNLQPIDAFKRAVKDVRIKANLEKIDVVILKNGSIFKGYIVEETDKKVVIKMFLKRGKAELVFDRNEIEKIKYGAEPLLEK